ncbi:hypothetical protein ACFC09_29910 [Streptomyces sp. NPDC056161]|uniref:hypothetical protein n=1 Tax=Streptomyces sp. NPDC056161 TaxID=3345732 RepID=UPI0035DC2B65
MRAGVVDQYVVEVDCDVPAYGDAELKILVLTASSGSADEGRFRLALAAAEGDSASVPAR